MLKRALICAAILLIASSCAKSAASIRPTSTPTTVASAELSPVPASFPSLPALTPTSSASPTPFTAFTVKPAVDNLKIRVNPGRLFEALMMVNQTDELTVLGTAPGNEWTYIKTADGDEGWVFSQLLQSSVDLSRVPVREPKNVVIIKGRVVDVSGMPIQGIGFDVSQGESSDVSSNPAFTDANGLFFSFLPDTASGAWKVSFTATDCKSNIWSDSTCTTYKPGFTGNVDPLTQTVNLPQSAEPLTFTLR